MAGDRPPTPQGTDIVIILTRLGNGMKFAVNPDLIERAEHTPDTVVTLIDGHKLVVEEPLDELVALVRAWRAAVAHEAITLAHLAPEGPHTSQLPSPRPGTTPPPASPDADDLESALLADRVSHRSALGQLLHLPHREV